MMLWQLLRFFCDRAPYFYVTSHFRNIPDDGVESTLLKDNVERMRFSFCTCTVIASLEL